ncbi:MAG: GNAT family N-acetyltransferase [Coriobacteriia bacterium]|nr:GNAT family N-acetyltransferase [Coriobacteriia bacterium]
MSDKMQLPFPHYRCAECGTDLPLTEARLTITCESHQPGRADVAVDVRPANPGDRHDIEDICDQALGETEVDVFGRSFDVLRQENLVAVSEGRFAGVISLAVDGGDLAVILLSVFPGFQGHGVGRALVAAAVAVAEERGLPAVKVAITNDDVPSFSFFQRHGFVIETIEKGLLADRYGSAEPGFSGIPVRDEIRLRRSVCRA